MLLHSFGIHVVCIEVIGKNLLVMRKKSHLSKLKGSCHVLDHLIRLLMLPSSQFSSCSVFQIWLNKVLSYSPVQSSPADPWYKLRNWLWPPWIAAYMLSEPAPSSLLRAKAFGCVILLVYLGHALKIVQPVIPTLLSKKSFDITTRRDATVGTDGNTEGYLWR